MTRTRQLVFFLPALFNIIALTLPLNAAEQEMMSPWIIAHRGASAYRPEHTLAAYELAIKQGADFIEPDLVPTRDGVLISRHENELSGTTNVADIALFKDRKTTKIIDGESVEGWFSEDFTLAEIKMLEAGERIPDIRPENRHYEDSLKILTLAEIIDIVRQEEASSGRRLNIIPEIKHPTYFAHEGSLLDGTPIAMDLGAMLITDLIAENFTDRSRVYIQCFEIAPLIALKNKIMPEAGVNYHLVQLLGDTSGQMGGFSRPYDMFYHSRRTENLNLIYSGLETKIKNGISDNTGYKDLLDKEVMAFIATEYASVLSPWKNSLYKIKPGDDSRRLQYLGVDETILTLAKKLKLKIIPYTVRADDTFLMIDNKNAMISGIEEAILLFHLGVDGIFTDHPDIGVTAKNQFLN